MSRSEPRLSFISPAVPFAGTILGGLQPGEMVLIQGSVPAHADRFQVDFTCGSSVKPRADVAFHFNPRLHRSSIVCNTLQGERWGREEILHLMPFTPQASFELLFLVLEDKFKVALNGAHVLEYKHRVELRRVDTLSISGKVKVQAVGILPSLSSASPAAARPTSQDSEIVPISCSGDLSVPFRAQLPRALRPGDTIAIKANINPDARSFTVNLRGGEDIALHLNPRLLQRVFIRNSFLSESWGGEERTLRHFPFTAGLYFEMLILCEQLQFRVAVNGLHQLDYKHRVQDLSRVSELEVVGDVTLLHASIF